MSDGVDPRKAAHDLLLAKAAPGAKHEPCDLCDTPPPATAQEGTVADPKTYTEDELKAEVQKAVAAALADRDAAGETETLKARVAELEGEVTSAKADVDRLSTELAAAAAAASEVEAYLAAEAQRIADEQVKAERRTARVDEATKLGVPADRVEARADEWAELDDPAWASLVDDLKAAGAGSTRRDPLATPSPIATAAARRPGSDANPAAAVAKITDLRRRGVALDHVPSV